VGDVVRCCDGEACKHFYCAFIRHFAVAHNCADRWYLTDVDDRADVHNLTDVDDRADVYNRADEGDDNHDHSPRFGRRRLLTLARREQSVTSDFLALALGVIARPKML
jgi:hypothetical protein